MVGVISEAKSSWPGDERPGAADRFPLQPDHTHYVTTPSGSEEELSSFRFSLAHAITTHPWHEVAQRHRAEVAETAHRQQLPVVREQDGNGDGGLGGVDDDAPSVTNKEKDGSSSSTSAEKKNKTSKMRVVGDPDGRDDATWDVEGQQLRQQQRNEVECSQDQHHAPLPCVSLVVSGGAAALRESLRCARYGWPLVVIKGTGGVADRIAAAIGNPKDYISDPIVTEIVQEANIEVIELADVDGGITGHMLKRIIAAAQSRLTAAFTAEPNVVMAWDRVHMFEQTARRQRATGKGIRTIIILLALTSTMLVCTNQSIESGLIRNTGAVQLDLQRVASVLSVMLLVLPIVSAVVRSYGAKARSLQKSLHLRAAAEELRSEIYCYRTCTGVYNLSNLSARNSALAEAMKRVNAAVANSVASEGGITSSVGMDINGNGYDANFRVSVDDDGISQLSPEEYIALRIVEERDVHRRKAATCQRILGAISIGNYVLGGVGTYLATMGRIQLYVSVTTAVSTAMISLGEEERLHDKLTAHTRALNEFKTLIAWWKSLSAIEKANPQNFAQLVEHAEGIMVRRVTYYSVAFDLNEIGHINHCLELT
jgi:hypothetical protein